jgi:hypothetical protein
MPGVQTTEQRDRFGVAFVVRQRRVPPSFVYESAGPVGRAESVPRSDVRGDVNGQHVARARPVIGLSCDSGRHAAAWQGVAAT